jgi:hypothetical protein
MGGDNTFHDAGHPKCDFAGFTIHLPTEDDQPSSERKKWERIQTVDCCVDVGQQVYVLKRKKFDAFNFVLTNFSPR